MFRFVSTLCAMVMAITMPFAAPAIAAPIQKPNLSWTQAAPMLVQYRHGRHRYNRHRAYNPHGYYLRGHRGYRQYRPGYRQHNGYWFPPAAFIAGAIIGGIIAGQRNPTVRYRSVGRAHVQWCYNRYRSYRAYDNTFQPYHGPRRPCRSPYN